MQKNIKDLKKQKKLKSENKKIKVIQAKKER